MYKEKLEQIFDNPQFRDFEMMGDFVVLKNLIKINHYKVVLYGVGKYGTWMVKYVKSKGFQVEYIINRSMELKGQFVSGVEFITPDQIEEKIKCPEEYCVLIFNSDINNFDGSSIITLLAKKGLYHCFAVRNMFYNVINNRHTWLQSKALDFFTEWYINKDKIYTALDLYEDDESREIVVEYIRSMIELDIYRLPEIPEDDKYWGTINGKAPLYRHLEDEVLVNCGSCTGDTIFSFIGNQYKFNKIYAFEGDSLTFSRCKNNINNYLPQSLRENIVLENRYLGMENEDFSFDKYFTKQRVSLINMDIEGAEFDVLKGGKQLIERDKPVLAICIYHKPSDLWVIPEFVKSCSEEYHIYIRKSVSHHLLPTGNSEFLMYAIPKNRCMS